MAAQLTEIKYTELPITFDIEKYIRAAFDFNVSIQNTLIEKLRQKPIRSTVIVPESCAMGDAALIDALLSNRSILGVPTPKSGTTHKVISPDEMMASKIEVFLRASRNRLALFECSLAQEGDAWLKGHPFLSKEGKVFLWCTNNSVTEVKKNLFAARSPSPSRVYCFDQPTSLDLESFNLETAFNYLKLVIVSAFDGDGAVILQI